MKRWFRYNMEWVCISLVVAGMLSLASLAACFYAARQDRWIQDCVEHENQPRYKCEERWSMSHQDTGAGTVYMIPVPGGVR